jgi:octaprenyl-diphosphate synthase
MAIVKRKKKTKDEIKEVIDFVSASGGLEYAELKMNLFRDKALAILDSYQDCDYKNSLKKFIYYTTSRNK